MLCRLVQHLSRVNQHITVRSKRLFDYVTRRVVLDCVRAKDHGTYVHYKLWANPDIVNEA